jgi:hypothetical protein
MVTNKTEESWNLGGLILLGSPCRVLLGKASLHDKGWLAVMTVTNKYYL